MTPILFLLLDFEAGIGVLGSEAGGADVDGVDGVVVVQPVGDG